jgi:hypothetical protein
MGLLDEVLDKQGIKAISDLNEEEKKIYSEWEGILNAKEITIDELKKFLVTEISNAELQLLNPNNSKEIDIFYKATLRILKVMSGFINSPENSKEWLKDYLASQFKVRS